MTFGNPAALWFAGLVIPILALHILKAQRTEVVVSSTLGWEPIDRPVAAARPWQRLRWSIPLLLQLLAVLLLAGALAQPGWDTGRVSAQHVVVMVDTSSSMASTDGSPDRLAAARDAVDDLLDDLGSSARVSLIATGSPARIVGSEIPASEVGSKLEQLSVSEGGFDGEATASLALSLDRPDRSVSHVLVSDGGVDASAIRLLPPGTRFVSVGRSSGNLGVTNIVVTPRGASLHVQTTVTNAGSERATAVIRTDVDGRTQATTSVRVPAGDAVESAVDVSSGKRVEVLLEGTDLLRLDDHVYAVGPALSKVSALVVGEADPFIDALIASNPNVEMTRLTPADFAAKTAASGTGGPSPFVGIDLAVFDQADVPKSVPVPYLAIAPPGGTAQVQVAGDVENPIPTLVRDDVDLLSDVDLKGLAIGTAQKVTARSASVLVGAEGAPLLLSGRDGATPFVYLAMPMSQSNLGLLPAFPVLGDRILNTLGRTDLVAGGLRVGDPLPVDASATAVVTSPTGTETTVEPGTLAPDLDRTGFWTVAVEGQGERVVVVNPDPAESRVRPVRELAIPGVRGGLDGDGEPVTRSLMPALIALALVVIAAEWWFSRRRRGVTLRQWRIAEAVRLAIVLALLVALVAPTFHRSSSDVATVFVVDVSDSMAGGRDAVFKAVHDALDDQPAGSVAGVVVVGAQARVDAAVKAQLRWSSPRTIVDGTATDLASGLRVAGALAPTDHARRVVLVSDGNPTTGEVSEEVSRLRRAGVRLDVVPVEPAVGADVAVSSIDVADRARSTDSLEVVVNLSATSAQTVTVTLLRDGDAVGEKVVDAPVGASEVVFTQPAGAPGSIEWSARVAGSENGIFENDQARAGTRVEGRASVLLVEGTPDAGRSLAAAFSAGGAKVTVTEPEKVGDLAALAPFDAIVLDNVAASRFSTAQTTSLTTATRDLGKGLLVVGGTSSYGAGDYLGSALEELLPVTSEVKDPKRRSRIAQVFAVDTSGSMGACHCAEGSDGDNSRLPGGVTKTDIARDAAVRALEAFHPDDELGVLALDDRQRWLFDLSPVGDGAQARRQMSDLEHSERSTNLEPSLEESAERLRASSASLRHIVLFTDGFTGTNKLDALARQAEELRSEGITVSVMGTGEGAASALRSIADLGGGRYYAGRDLKELPDLLLEETKVVARQLIVEGEFLPEVSSAAAIVATLTEAPLLRGYVATTAKPTATQHLRIGDEKDPLLASWRVGLGQVVSWTGDSGQRWASDWAAWDGNVAFWSGVLRSIYPTPAGSARLRFNGAQASIEATFDDAVPDGAQVTAQVVDPAGVARTVQLERVDSTNFRGSAEVGAAGTYGVGVTASVDGKAAAAIAATAELGFSREYLSLGVDRSRLREMSVQTGGRGVIAPSAAFDAEGLIDGDYEVDLRAALLISALVLWPVATALSRLRLRSAGPAVAPLRKPRQRQPVAGSTGAVSPPEEEPSSSLDSLLAAKRRRREE